MTDLERRIRDEVTRRGDGFAPARDLPARIRARVARRRRRERLVAGGLAAGLATAAVLAGVLVARPGPERDTVETAGGGRTTTTAGPPPSTSAALPPATAGSAPAVPRTSGTAPPPSEPDETSPPPSAASSSTTTTTASDLEPAVSSQPAAGVCPPAAWAVVEVVLAPDVPSPRCAQVGPDQGLRVRNDSGQPVDVTFAGSSAALAPGASHAFAGTFGDLLEPGVHRVAVSLYGDSGAEIWLLP